ncbi:MAG: sugar transferase [Acidobacteriia bacterium]|nr:sugar transferase [Terriglobia bacterium]
MDISVGVFHAECDLRSLADSERFCAFKMSRHTLAGQELAEITNERKQLVLKRALDLFGAAILLLLLSPLFVLLCLLVALEDGWPVFYRRRVVGENGEFDAYKFRSMRQNADAILAADPVLKQEFERNFKLKHDPRVTTVGSALRKLSLDELPQLFNVLKGQMSLVGPRMISPPELEKYGSHKELLLTVKPGLTGYWQVNGRQKVGYDERVKMDLHYINNWSLAMDLKILFKTPYAVLKREGAY